MSEAIEMITRLAASTRTVDAERRTVEVIFAAGAAVKRRGYQGEFIEELSMEPGAVRLDRLNSGASLLDTHDSWSMASRLGTVVKGSARVANGRGTCTVQFSRGPLADRLLQDLADGMPLQISVGYRVHASERIDGEGDLPVIRATDWEPMEISAVPIPADPGAHSRNLTSNPEQSTMTDTATPRLFGPEQRQALVEKYNMTAAFFRRHANTPEAEFRGAILDAIEARQSRNPAPIPFDHVRYGDDDADTVEAMADGLLARALPSHVPSERGRQYAGLTIVELARHALGVAGHRTNGSPSEVISRAFNSTSDFPEILAATFNKSLGAAYQPAAAALKAVAHKTTARDFKDKNKVRLGEHESLLKVNENGEFKRTTVGESKESYRLATFGRVFAITRQALINDDLGAFVDLPRQLARAAEGTEAELLAGVLASNPMMGDGTALFHANHGNLAASGSAISVTSLSAARLAMRQQTGLNKKLITVTPKFLIVGPEKETEAESVLAAIAAAKVDDVNPFSGKLQLIVENRLPGKAWYLAASTGEIDGLEYANLEGNEAPYTETRHGFDVDGMEVKVRIDFAAAFVEWRSWYKNPGA